MCQEVSALSRTSCTYDLLILAAALYTCASTEHGLPEGYKTMMRRYALGRLRLLRITFVELKRSTVLHRCDQLFLGI